MCFISNEQIKHFFPKKRDSRSPLLSLCTHDIEEKHSAKCDTMKKKLRHCFPSFFVGKSPQCFISYPHHFKISFVAKKEEEDFNQL